MSTRERIQELKDALLTAGPTVYESWAHKAKAPYIVWLMDGGNDLKANGKTQEQSISGTIHLFERATAKESYFDGVQKALNCVACAWSISSIQQEQETGLVHYEWSWEVC